MELKPSIFTLGRIEKERITGQKGLVVWISGLSGSGKSTLANEIEKMLYEKSILTQILDGDSVRMGLNQNLSFSMDDRKENIRRVAEVAKMFKDCGIVTICCFVSPTQELRQLAKDIIGREDFLDVFLSASIECCEKRDVKGWYAKARNGMVKNFTGVDSPFEKPLNADLVLDTENKSVKECAIDLFNFIENKIR